MTRNCRAVVGEVHVEAAWNSRFLEDQAGEEDVAAIKDIIRCKSCTFQTRRIASWSVSGLVKNTRGFENQSGSSR
jgi:hypothetical protein